MKANNTKLELLNVYILVCSALVKLETIHVGEGMVSS